MIAVVCIVCALVGLALGFMVARVKMSGVVESVKAQLLIERNNTEAVRQLAEDKAKGYEKSIADMKNNAEQLKNEAEQRLQQTKAEADQRLRQSKEEAAQRETAAKQEREEDFNRQLQAMEDKFRALSERLLKERSEEFRGANKEQMDAVTRPLLDAISNMRTQMGENRSGNEKSIAELKGALQHMMEQSAKLSKDAEGLTNALKGNSKVQGDWGEQVLANILQESGLRENIEYFTQKSFTGKDNKEYRPDVIVKAADGTQIIVDSKVSLTAYADYNAAETEEEMEKASKANLDSVRAHVEELAKKNYPDTVPHALPYVLMFVPNEGSYILAMNRDPKIGIEAYKKGVIIINPTNLMLALSLILRTWQNTRQEENCAKIMDAARDLYEKFCIFSETFVTVGKQLQTVSDTYGKAEKQLNSGKGNIVSRLDGMQKLGVTSTKRISEKLLQQEG